MDLSTDTELYTADETNLMKILVVEDEQKVASFIRDGLQAEQYAVDVAYDGVAGIRLAEQNDYDVIVLDIMMPKVDGITALKKIREHQIATPVLMLTAKAELAPKLESFEAGADDYLTKPFHFEELLARIRALAKRTTSLETSVLALADLRLDLVAHKAYRGDQYVDLTSREFALLEYLLRNKGRVVTRAMIVEHVWNEMFDRDTNVIEVYVMYLRKKIDGDFEPKLIHTVRGMGYIMKLPDGE